MESDHTRWEAFTSRTDTVDHGVIAATSGRRFDDFTAQGAHDDASTVDFGALFLRRTLRFRILPCQHLDDIAALEVERFREFSRLRAGGAAAMHIFFLRN